MKTTSNSSDPAWDSARRQLGDGLLSIIMPAYNETRRIVSSIKEVAKTFNDFGCPWELIVMDDGSTDNTYYKAEELIKKYPGQLNVKKNPFNLGKGRAIKKALRLISQLLRARRSYFHLRKKQMYLSKIIRWEV